MGEMDIKQRLTYIDIARAIGILFVVLGHVNQFYRDSLKCTLCQGHYDFSFSDFYFIFVCCVEASK